MLKLRPIECIRGRVRAYNGGRRTPWQHNDVLFDWSVIVGTLLTQAGGNYKLAGMLLEFKNLANADDPVTAPVFDRTGNIDYYNALSSSPDVDYLRVPLLASSLAPIDDGGSLLTFFAQSEGLLGANGKPFTDSDNSKVYGGALVSIVDPADRTRDLVFSRFYLAADNQQIKLPSSQIGLQWELSLT